ncbi:MAG: hypothetical protein ABFE08_08265 [Armatimonadia bacterium]
MTLLEPSELAAKERLWMKYVPPAMLVLALLVQIAPAVGQDVPERGLRLPIRVTGNIPVYLELQVTQAQDSGLPLGTRVLTVLVRANSPWVLKAQMMGSMSGGKIEQVGQSGGLLELKPGQATSVPCRVKHFAGEHPVQFRFVPGTEGAGPVDAAGGLRLWLEAVEGASKCSEVVEVH